MKPTILLAAEAPNVYLAARFYAALNFSILPCAGKRPALDYWKHLQKRPALPPTIDQWNQCGLLQNVGIICGHVSGGLVVIDLDGLDAFHTFCARWPELLDTYNVASGSGDGMHFYYYTAIVPPTTRVVGLDCGNIELRADGCYVVAPPSIHPISGNQYRVNNDAPIKTVPDLRNVAEWIKGLIKQKHGGTMPPPSSTPVYNSTAYGRAALRGEAEKVANANAGARNHTLFEAALRMGSLVRDQKISAAEVESALFAAAASLTASDGEAATARTIQSGLQRGMENSRDTYKRA